MVLIFVIFIGTGSNSILVLILRSTSEQLEFLPFEYYRLGSGLDFSFRVG